MEEPPIRCSLISGLTTYSSEEVVWESHLGRPTFPTLGLCALSTVVLILTYAEVLKEPQHILISPEVSGIKSVLTSHQMSHRI